MKKIIVISLSAGLLLGAVVSRARATDPAAAPAAKEAGRVLVLENERTLTGDIERVGDRYRIKRLVGETWIPAGSVLKLCTSLEEAYGFLKRRANLNDADERLRLADWCRQHGLRDAAVEEAKEAASLRPRDERIRRLVTHLQEAKARAETPPAYPPAPPTEAPRVEVTAESLGTFATKVQPVLMNACISCHTGGRGGSFQLVRVATPGLLSRRSTELNLAAVLPQLNSKEPGASKLLQKAISVHAAGMTQAPLKGRDVPAFRLLESWAVRTVESNAQFREEVAHASVAPPAGAPRRAEEGTFGKDREAKPPDTPAPATVAESKPASAKASDPVDPESFNREFHPEKKGPPSR
jgi:hypothetical protein